MQALGRVLIIAFSYNGNHSNRDTNSGLLSFVSAKPEVANVLAVDLAPTVIALDLEELDPVVMDSFKNSKKFLHPGPHLIAPVIHSIVLVVEGDIFRVELEARAPIIASGIDGVSILLEESSSGSRWAIFLPLSAGNLTDNSRHGVSVRRLFDKRTWIVVKCVKLGGLCRLRRYKIKELWI